MKSPKTLLFLILASAMWFSSCAHVSRRMPSELQHMRAFLSQDDPGKCQTYTYNFERQIPRLYSLGERDSVLDVIDFMKSECGPSADLEVTRVLVLSERGQFGDSLIGSSTIPQMLWFRSDREGLLLRSSWQLLYGGSQPVDNSHDNFINFRSELARRLAADTSSPLEARPLGQFYSGNFDSALAAIQSDQFRGTALRKGYDDFVAQTKRMFPTRGHMAILIGSWRPRGSLGLLGNHPDFGFQLGGEGKRWRFDGTVNYRFSQTKNKFRVDSLGQIIETNEFRDWSVGGEAGLKLWENSRFSTDLFGTLGYDWIVTVTTKTDPYDYKSLGSFSAGLGVRQRLFLERQTGWYVGVSVRYSVLGYSNPGGTKLSGGALTVAFATGLSFHETLNQFLKKLNYKGNWRP